MFWLISLIATGVLGAFFLLFRLGHYLESNNARAELSKARRGDRFVLYLRAFDADEPWADMPAPSWGLWGVFGLIGNFVRHPAFSTGVRFERFIKRVAAAKFRGLPVVAVAGERETLGIGRVQIEAHSWQSEVSSLCIDAKAIAFLVGGSSGLIWELTHIIEARHLSKTVFIIPPWDIMQRHYGVAAEVIIKRARDLFASVGIDLPRPNWTGRVFLVSDTKVISFVGDIDLHWSSDTTLNTAFSAVAARP